MTDPLIDLQTRLAFQEEGLNELGDILTGQQRQIDLLRREISALQDKYRELLDLIEAGPPAHEKPPHY